MTCPRCGCRMWAREGRVPRAFYKNGQACLVGVCEPCEMVLDLPKAGESRPARSDS